MRCTFAELLPRQRRIKGKDMFPESVAFKDRETRDIRMCVLHGGLDVEA